MVLNTYTFLLHGENDMYALIQHQCLHIPLSNEITLSTADSLLPALISKVLSYTVSSSSNGADSDGISWSFPIITTVLYTTTLFEFIQLFPQTAATPGHLVFLTRGAVTTT